MNAAASRTCSPTDGRHHLTTSASHGGHQFIVSASCEESLLSHQRRVLTDALPNGMRVVIKAAHQERIQRKWYFCGTQTWGTMIRNKRERETNNLSYETHTFLHLKETLLCGRRVVRINTWRVLYHWSISGLLAVEHAQHRATLEPRDALWREHTAMRFQVVFQDCAILGARLSVAK